MKITIDTKHDSVEDIEKVVKLLQELNCQVSSSSLPMMDIPSKNLDLAPLPKKEHYSAPLTGFNEILSSVTKKPKKENVEVVSY